MRKLKRALAFGGTLLAGLLVLTSSGAAQDTSPTLTTLHSFGGPPADGTSPTAPLAIGSDGVLYGATDVGGSLNVGMVFSLTPPAAPGGAWTEAVLYSFLGYPSDGADDSGGVAIGHGGILYGTTYLGGSLGGGIVFSLTPPATPGGPWTETILHNFFGGVGGSEPQGGVVIGSGGVLYGVTQFAGASGAGTVFALRPPESSGGAWTLRTLYSFAGGSDAFEPSTGVAIGAGGVLYGTTQYGGTSGNGTVFSLTPPTQGTPWTETVLYSFAGTDGANPSGAIAIGSGGVLYGTTASGGTSGNGTVFSLTPPAAPGSPWTETVLYAFMGGQIDGGTPKGGVAIGPGGKLYGTAYGPYNLAVPNGGTVFVLEPPASPGGSWTERVLHRFTSSEGASDGKSPVGIVIGGAGVLYGVNAVGGTSDNGTIFSLTK